MSLEQVVTSVLSGGPVAPGAPPEPSAPRTRASGRLDALTRREREVAKLVALGYTDRRIADELTITDGTAGIHVHHILEKLRLRSRVQVADWAIVQGLIDKKPN
jgi:DNA-binding NarL/FixJ family response regulator